MQRSAEDSTVLLRGHRSSMGSAIFDALTAAGCEVVVDDLGDGRGATSSPSTISCVVDARLADYDLVGQMTQGPAAAIADTIDVATRVGVDHLVVITSAMVYGALPNNPLPLTEDAVLRPALDFDFGRQLAAAEELVDEWRRSDASRAVAVLRPAVPIGTDGNSSLVGALTAGLGQRFARDDPPAQFVHVIDVAAAVAIAVHGQLDGVYNVAPDSWIPGDRLRALAGSRPRVPLPDRVAEVVGSLRWRFQRGPIPPGLGSYIREPWVIGNDKLKRTGWTPTVTNEQAFVEGTESPWWSTITPQRRQELALGALVVAIAAALVGVSSALRWWVRRR